MSGLKVLMVTPEAVPYAKTGGLADVAGALPEALARQGCDVRCVMPYYSRIIDADTHGLKPIADTKRVAYLDDNVDYRMMTTETTGGVTWYLLDAPLFFGRDEMYAVYGEDYDDNFHRFTFFAQQTLAFIKELDWKPDVIHCHDWQTGLIPTYLTVPVQTSVVDTTDPFFEGIRTLFTIHNIAYQGLVNWEMFSMTGIDWSHFHPGELEYYGKFSFLKAGLANADRLNAVSQRYAEEVQTWEEFGRGMEGVLAWRSHDLTGILNGIDQDVWNPETDPLIPENYSLDDLTGKAACTKALRDECGLDQKPGVPLIGIISRLDPQKGFDLIEEAFDEIMESDVQMVVLGTGKPVYHEMLEKLALKYGGDLSVNLRFDNGLAHRIEAGSDMFLMPSRFEPCGLNQMYSLRYGTVPIVHATGGLADTVSDYAPLTGRGNGFSFEEYEADQLVDAVKRAVDVYAVPDQWRALMRTGMSGDYSWQASASRYLDLYREMIDSAPWHPW
jgi:starch synthase